MNHRNLFSITWPIFVEQLARILPGTISALMLSHLGDQVVAAVTVSNQIVIFFVIVFSFVGIGSSVVLTHYLGARDHDGAERIAVAAVGVNVWLGVAVSFLLALFAKQVLQLLQLPAGLMDSAQPYLAIVAGSLFLEAISIALAALLRAHGHTRDPMSITLGMNLLNLCLSYVLIFGVFGFPKMGVVGAALATVIGRLVACVALAWMVHRRIHFKMRLHHVWKVSGESVRRILHIGLPAAGENLSWWMSFMAITILVGQMGETALATFSYVRQISMLLMMLPLAIGAGTEIMIGHMVGSGDVEAAYHQLLRSLRLSFIIAFVVSAMVALVAPQLLRMFTSAPAVIASGALLVRCSLILEPGRTFNLVVINALRATGDARFPVLMGVLSMWGLAVPLAWVFGVHLGWGLPGVWVAFITDEWVRGIAMYVRWKSRVWERHAHASRSSIANAVG